jgi:hypothetical protein
MADDYGYMDYGSETVQPYQTQDYYSPYYGGGSDPYASTGMGGGNFDFSNIDWSQYGLGTNQPTNTTPTDMYDYGLSQSPSQTGVVTPGLNTAGDSGGGILSSLGLKGNDITSLAGILTKLFAGNQGAQTKTAYNARNIGETIQQPSQRAYGLQGAQSAIGNIQNAIPNVNQADMASLLGMGQRNLNTLQQQVIDPTTYLAQYGANIFPLNQYKQMVDLSNKLYGPDYLRQQIAPLMSNQGVTGGADLQRVVDQSSGINNQRNQAILTAMQNLAGATTGQNQANLNVKQGAMSALPGLLGAQSGLVTDPYNQALQMGTAGGNMTLQDLLSLANASTSPTGMTQGSTGYQTPSVNYGGNDIMSMIGQYLASAGSAGSVQSSPTFNQTTQQWVYPPQQNNLLSSLFGKLGLS